jgi:L-rhamnose mutarotase
MEYTGSDYESDMALIAADPETQRWWKITDPMQVQVPEARDGEWWHTLHQNFHLD